VAAHKVCDEVADDSVGGALSFCDDPGHQGLCGGVPFEVDSAVDAGVCAVELRPAGASARGLLAGDGEIVFLQALVVGDGLAEAAATIAGYLDNALHWVIPYTVPCGLPIVLRTGDKIRGLSVIVNADDVGIRICGFLLLQE